jgi:hypothetical protein
MECVQMKNLNGWVQRLEIYDVIPARRKIRHFKPLIHPPVVAEKQIAVCQLTASVAAVASYAVHLVPHLHPSVPCTALSLDVSITKRKSVSGRLKSTKTFHRDN